jgi:hypothetical protein
VLVESLHCVMRFGQLGAGLVVVGVLAVGGCGGTTQHDGDVRAAAGQPASGAGGAGGTGSRNAGGTAGSGGAGAEPTIPTFHGVPIGDCRLPSDATRTDGCPVEPPEDSRPCEAPNGLKTCTYDIQVSDGRANQVVYTCHPDQLTWGSLYAPCGLVCGSLSGDVIELGTNCSAREPVSCKSSDSVFAFETEQQWLDDAFGRLLSDCLGQKRYNRQIQLELADGCGTRLSSNVAFSSDEAACLKKQLDNVRWECGLRLSCTIFASYAL